jgi:trimeric autotransporter adhesin
VSRKEAKARAAASVATAARTASVASAATRVAPAAAVAAPPAPVPATKAPAPARKQASAAGPKAGRAKKRRSRRRIAFGVAAGAGCAAVAAAVVAAEALTGSAQAHSITTPTRLGDYVQAPALAAGMGASALRAKIVASSNGEASHVLDAVYDDSTGPAAKSGPLIILFVGGNLTGSAGSFIQSLTQTLPGAFVTSAGTLPGQAACVPSAHGRLAECAWADNDTFGVIASPVLSATALASELRQMRPQLEHARKK